jgi:hypothetical protein
MIKPYVIQVTPENQEFMAQKAAQLSGDGGDGTSYGMDARVTRLETHMEYVRSDLSELKAGQKETTKALSSLASSLEKLPTKNDLWAWKLTWLTIALVGFATIVGGIIGGLDWIKTH